MFGRRPKLQSVLAVACIAGANALICGRLFFTEYLNQMGSVDGPFIAMARYAMDHPGDTTWWPLWFGGMPYQNVYGPLLPHTVAVLARLSHLSAALIFHALTAVFYCLAPVTLYWMTFRFSGSRQIALATALVYSLISPTVLLFPSIRQDAGGLLHLRKLQDLAVYGEAPHDAALCWIPVVLIALDVALRRNRGAYWVLTALLIAGIAITNVTGAVGFALVGLAYLIAKPVNEYASALLRTVLLGLLAFALVVPCLPPSTIRAISANSQWSTGANFPFTSRHVLYLAVIAAATALLRWMLRSRSQTLRMGLLLTFLGLVIMTPWVAFGIAVLPQPIRFQLEFEIGFALAAGCLIAGMLARFPGRTAPALLAVVSAALLTQDAMYGYRLLEPVDIHKTTEFQQAVWFRDHMGNRRVFAPGSVSLWMNIFTDTPQIGGCCDQGVPNWEQRVALYTIYTGQNTGPRDGEVSLLWLKAYGAHAAGISGRNGREYFKVFGNPAKFEGLLEVLWRDGEDVIYRVPQRTASLAHVVRAGDLVSRPPSDGLDIAQLRTYVDALDDSALPTAEMIWTTAHSASITASLAPDDLLSIQSSYFPGWEAKVNGEQRSVSSDALGQIVVHPGCSGACVVELGYTGGTEMRAAQAVRICGVLACAFLLLRRRQNSV